jgi:hypothetical protein
MCKTMLPMTYNNLQYTLGINLDLGLCYLGLLITYIIVQKSTQLGQSGHEGLTNARHLFTYECSNSPRSNQCSSSKLLVTRM